MGAGPGASKPTPLRQKLAPLSPVLRHAFAPAVRMGQFVRLLTAFTAIAAPVAAYILGIPVPWLVAGGLTIVAGLFLRSAFHFYREAHPDFPRHDMEVGTIWHAEIKDMPEHETRYVFLPIRYTNRDPERPVNLHFELVCHRVFGEQVLGAGRLTPSENRVISAVALPTPLKVKPLDTEKGDVAFSALSAIALEFDEDLMTVSARDHFRVTLRVTDYASGAVLERPALRSTDHQ